MDKMERMDRRNIADTVFRKDEFMKESHRKKVFEKKPGNKKS